jgi:hypothetical protein
VNERPCLRCAQPVALENGHLVYCSHCGAPQIFLSEELQERIADESRAYAERGAAGSEVGADGLPGPPRSLEPAEAWPLAIQYALTSAGIALLFCLVSVFVPSVGILAWLWVISAPILVVGFYNARSRGNLPGSSFAARLGLLTSLLVVASCVASVALGLVVTRFVVHHAGSIDAQVSQTFDQAAKNAVARFGPAVTPGLTILRVPEFRVGLMLWMTGVGAACYLFVSTVAAGLAGLLLSRRRSV